MIYLSWAALYEGSTDHAYFSVIIPVLMEELVRCHGTCEAVVPQTSAVQLGRSGRTLEAVASEICQEEAAFHIAFIHADTGGRALEAGMAYRSDDYKAAAHALCGFPPERCVIIAPRHETEAWILADLDAVANALGYRGNLATLGLPSNAQEAERLVDPKAVLRSAIVSVRGRRASIDIQQIIPAIAQRQNMEHLRRSRSFRDFEEALANALRSLGCMR